MGLGEMGLNRFAGVGLPHACWFPDVILHAAKLTPIRHITSLYKMPAGPIHCSAVCWKRVDVQVQLAFTLIIHPRHNDR